MLKVNIDLHPFGEDYDVKTIQSIYIANIGIKRVSNGKTLYHYWVNVDPREKVPSPSDPLHLINPPKHGKVWHLREDGANELLRKVLNQAKRQCLF